MINYVKSHTMTLSFILRADIDQIFQMKYCTFYLENENQDYSMTFNIIYVRSKYPYFTSYRGLY